MAMDEPLETIMEVREDFMVSPAGDSEPTLRTAHLLKPIATSIDEAFSETLSSSLSLSPMFEPKEWPLKVHFNGWRRPQTKWVSWVDALRLRYEAVWKKVGIFEAIMSTKCYIVRNLDLVFGVTERWCSETNTFVFPWGEATITLEDVLVLGGYPVLGDPVFTSLENQEMKEVKQKLILARKEPWRSKKGKAYTSSWIDNFMNSGSEVEHEAFLATWLSVFVFPHKNLVKQSVFPIAILLARGNLIALAPAVLASMYKDLGMLKEILSDLTKNPVVGGKKHIELEVALESPLYLVQVWVWERFKNLQPEPLLINNGDPILFRWHKVSSIKIDNVRLALDSAIDDFLWRPYVRSRYDGKCRLLYAENDILVPVEADLDKELASFVICIRFSLLVGIDTTIMQYLPHRVSMQFGMDQDVPAHVPAFNGTMAIAWENYSRPISDRNLYLPSRLFEADVTIGYARWWKQSVLHHQDLAKTISTVILGKSSDDRSKTAMVENDADSPPPDFHPKRLKTVRFGNSVQDGLKANENAEVDVENHKPVLEENKCGGIAHSLVKVAATNECKHLLNQYSSTSSNAKDNTEPPIASLKEGFEDANGSKESSQSRTQGEIYSFAKALEVEKRIHRLERLITKLMKARRMEGR